MLDIALINMPFASLNHPAFSLAQFKAKLNNEKISSKIYELNFLLAQMIGIDEYEGLSRQDIIPIPLSCWLFKSIAWDSNKFNTIESLKEASESGNSNRFKMDSKVMTLMFNLKNNIIPSYIDACVEKIVSNGIPKIAAFTCSYFQFVPSAALAKTLKQRYPQIKIIFGGAEFRDYMGQALMAPLDYIDAVSIGEADDIFIKLVRALLDNRPPLDCQGILYRNADKKIIQSAPAKAVDVTVIENNPVPDFSDYIKTFKETTSKEVDASFFFPIEASRGCEKGEKFHCAFCGLNDLDRTTRKKSADRVLANILEIKKKYPEIKRLHFTDNLVPQEYFKTLLPKLKDIIDDLDIEFFFEVRTTIRRKNMKLLSQCNFTTVQPGIESLSTNILNAMRKGVSMIKNIHFLKMCREYSIYPNWNLLIHVPGETEKDYQDICKLIPMLVHFTPPSSEGHVVSMQPFSPYWTEYFEHGKWATKVEPKSWYYCLFSDAFDINKIAYFYEADWNNIVAPQKLNNLKNLVGLWRSLWRNTGLMPKLEYKTDKKGLITITDSRSLKKGGSWEFDKKESAVYSLMADPVTIKHVHNSTGDLFNSPEEITLIADEMVKFGLAVREKNRYLGLACNNEA